MTRANLVTTHLWEPPRSWSGGILRGLWLVYLCSYPIAVIGVAFDVRPGFSMVWAGSVLLFVQGGIAATWLWYTLGTWLGALAAGIVAIGAFAVETVGVASGVPFGKYHYTAVLFPQLPGTVPLPVIGAWLLVVAASVGTAQLLWPRAPIAVRVALAALLGTALDLVLEPVAARVVGYWIWQSPGIYDGVPATNFLGWAALCAALAAIVFALWRPVAQPRPCKRWVTLAETPFWQYVLTMGMFTAIDLTHGIWGATGIGILSLCALAYRVRWAYDNG